MDTVFIEYAIPLADSQTLYTPNTILIENDNYYMMQTLSGVGMAVMLRLAAKLLLSVFKCTGFSLVQLSVTIICFIYFSFALFSQKANCIDVIVVPT